MDGPPNICGLLLEEELVPLPTHRIQICIVDKVLDRFFFLCDGVIMFLLYLFTVACYPLCFQILLFESFSIAMSFGRHFSPPEIFGAIHSERGINLEQARAHVPRIFAATLFPAANSINISPVYLLIAVHYELCRRR